MTASAAVFTPASAAELADAVRSTPRVIVVGAGTKPRLASVGPEFTRLATANLRGIVEYEASEFTFTALAGTPVAEIVAALAEKGQYLPFDPMLTGAGATIGGTVAAGLSGAGRFRFGTIRDFILGVQFVDGAGRLLRMGGKVVKNAAGFDVPKFFVGGLGRFGVMTEITFKVFPRPLAMRTLRLQAPDAVTKAKIFCEAGSARWEIDALDAPAERPEVLVRIGGPAVALDALAAEILARWPGATVAETEAEQIWRGVGEFAWAHADGALIKVALTPKRVAEFTKVVATVDGGRGWLSAGGNAGYFSRPKGVTIPAIPFPALTLRGGAPLWPGERPRFEIMSAVKRALDPNGRFPGLDD